MNQSRKAFRWLLLLLTGAPLGLVVAGRLIPSMFAASQIASQLPAFEVASVKPSNSEDLDYSRYQAGGRYSAKLSLRALVGIAYRSEIDPAATAASTSPAAPTISGGPDWVDSARFSIEAKAPAGIVSRGSLGRQDTDKLALMLRALLTDRFNLKLRAENKEAVVYSLIVARNGPKLPTAKEGANCKTPDGWDGIRTEDISPTCHVFLRLGPRVAIGQSVDMNDMVRALATILKAPVENKTGLKGLYDPEFHWRPGPQNRPATEEAVVIDSNDPDLFTALQEQLGLKLESRKGPVKHLIIESAQKPSEN